MAAVILVQAGLHFVLCLACILPSFIQFHPDSSSCLLAFAHPKQMVLVLHSDPGAACDEGSGGGRGPNGEPLLLMPVSDVMLHNDCQGSYRAHSRWGSEPRLIANCIPGSRAAALADYPRQLQVGLHVGCVGCLLAVVHALATVEGVM